MINWNIEKFKTLKSTQDYLKESIYNNCDLPEGVVISADSQSHGYGRYARKWECGRGNIFISFLIRPECNLDKIGQIALLTALAVSKAIGQNISKQLILKWPNDILIGSKKCCGILIDAAPAKNEIVDYLIIGVGVNIKSAPIEMSCFIEEYSEVEIDKYQFLEQLLSCFSDYYKEWGSNGFEKLHGEWLSKTYVKGQKIMVKIHDNQIEGVFDTIDMFGNLILICNKSGERQKVTSGEVFLI